MTTIIDLNTKPQVELSEGWNTPLGNALILIDLANGYIRFDAVNNQWLVWKGTHFQVDDKKTVGDLATRIPDILLAHTQQADLIAHITSNYSTAALVELEKWSEKSRQANLIQSTIQIAAMRNEIQLPPREVNESADILNTKTGTINLAANTTSKHDPNDNITKVTTVGVGDAAKCTNWLNTLDMVFDSQEMVDYFQRVAGYTLTGHVTEQCFFFLYGKGRNGKSTVVNALAYALGDYARKININTLSLDNGQQYELADLQGMRMVFTSEVEQGNHLAESLIKDFTGGD